MGNDNQFLEKVREIQLKSPSLYIYGAGLYARNIYQILKENMIKVDGFIVTRIEEDKELFGLPVINADNVIDRKSVV